MYFTFRFTRIVFLCTTWHQSFDCYTKKWIASNLPVDTKLQSLISNAYVERFLQHPLVQKLQLYSIRLVESFQSTCFKSRRHMLPSLQKSYHVLSEKDLCL